MKKICLMRLIFFMSSVVIATHGRAQVGIGTNGVENPSAKLEVKSSTQGFLPPRVNLTGTTDVSTVTSPATGLLVFNLATANTGAAAVSPGYYYYDGTKWQRMISPDGAETLTNKTISGSANTITNVSLTSGVTGTLPIANGGTGQTTANAALNALLPSQTSNANKVLVTNGTSTSWETNVALTSAILGTINTTSGNIGQNTNTGTYIDLPNGKWSVQVTMMAKTGNSGTFWIRTFFSDATSGTNPTNDAIGSQLVSSLIQGSPKYNMIIGTIILNNTSGASKRYFYRTSAFDVYDGGTLTGMTLENFAKTNWGENSIVAYPMN